MSSQWGSPILLKGLVSHELTASLSKACKPACKACKPFLESNSPEVLALCETNLGGSIDSGNFFGRVYLPLIWKDSCTHTHGLAVYVEKVLPFTRAFLKKTLQIFNYVFDWLYFTQCLTSFSSINHFPCLCVLFLILFHLT